MNARGNDGRGGGGYSGSGSSGSGRSGAGRPSSGRPSSGRPGAGRSEGGRSGRSEGGYQGGRSEGRPASGRSEGGYQGGRSTGGYQGGRSEGRPASGRSEGGYQGNRSEGRPAPGRSEGGYQGGRSEGGYQGNRSEGGYQGNKTGGGTGRGGAGKPAAGGRPAQNRSGSKPGYGRAANAGRPGSHPNRPKVNRPERPDVPAHDVHVADGVRLQKILADAGFGSRRACEVMITDGRVEVGGQIITELGVRVEPQGTIIHVDGMRLQLDTNKITILFNKPVGVVSTMEDPEGRQCLGDYFKNREERLFHVGRLDQDSEGLLLLTNDGDLANRLSHPKYEIGKTYLVQVDGKITPTAIDQLMAGVNLEDGPARADRARIVDTTLTISLVELVMHEGRNRIVRRMLDAVGFPVTRLVRTQIGRIKLGDLPPGRQRILGRVELGTLMSEVGL